MATDNAQHRVLLVGKSQLVLDESVAGLRGLGYKAEATNDFADITGRFDVKEIDLVVFGGQVPADRKGELREEIRTIKSGVIFVQGLAGIPGVHGQPPGHPPSTDLRARRSVDPADPRKPGRCQGDRLVADHVRATRPQERFAPAPRRPARRRRLRNPGPRSRSAQSRLRHRTGRRGKLRLQHRHGAMTANQD